MKSIKDGEPYPLWLPGEPTLKQVDILKNTLHMRKIFIYEENTLLTRPGNIIKKPT